MSSVVSTRVLEEKDYPAWNKLVAASPDGSIYSTPEYLDILCQATGASFRILAAERGGELIGGIALYEQSDPCGQLVSGRYLLYYNGFVLKLHPSRYPSVRTSVQLETLGALEEAIAQQGFGRVRIKSRHTISDVRIFLTRGWSVDLTYSYVVPLGDLPALWERVEQNLRRLVTRSEKEGLQFTFDDDFDAFYSLHQQTHLRKGAAIYLEYCAFRKYFERLRASNLARLFQVRNLEGRVMSTQLVLLGSHPVSHTVAAAADPEYLKSGATAFLRWKCFEWLAEANYQANDLTDAELNSVTHFKSQLGGDLQMNLMIRTRDNMAFQLRDSFYRTASSVKGRLRGNR